MKINKYVIVENGKFIIHSAVSMAQDRIFDTKKDAKEYKKCLEEARGDISTFEIVELKGETK